MYHHPQYQEINMYGQCMQCSEGHTSWRARCCAFSDSKLALCRSALILWSISANSSAFPVSEASWSRSMTLFERFSGVRVRRTVCIRWNGYHRNFSQCACSIKACTNDNMRYQLPSFWFQSARIDISLLVITNMRSELKTSWLQEPQQNCRWCKDTDVAQTNIHGYAPKRGAMCTSEMKWCLKIILAMC